MYHVNAADLPGNEVSRTFEGGQHGPCTVSFFLVNNRPGEGPALDRHAYDETFIILEGRVLVRVGDESLEGGPGDIVIGPAGTPHGFTNSGPGPARLQYGIQYDLNACCLRAPWIMEKDDFRYQLSFREDVFGGPRWRDLVGADQADAYAASGTIPVMLDEQGRPVKRNFVHVNDLADAILLAIGNPAARRQTFNICMDEPVDYGELGAYLAQSRGLPTVGVRTPYHSTWLDNTKAKFLLGWRPRYDLRRLTDEAWSYQRSPDDPRVIWYPG